MSSSKTKTTPILLILWAYCVSLACAKPFSITMMQPQTSFQRNNMLVQVRGGAIRPAKAANRNQRAVAPTTTETTTSVSRRQQRIQSIALWGSLTTVVSYLVFQNRVTLRRLLLDKDYLQTTVLDLLEQIKDRGPYGILVYILGLALWEGVGLSTIPVETAAGMAFGWKGLLASVAGKLLGATVAYGLGRSVLRNFIRSKLEENPVLSLVDGSVASKPFQTALLMRYSCFPEFVKNTGASLFPPIDVWRFILSIVCHGLPFTLVWTYLGVDTARRLVDSSLAPDHLLKACLVLAFLVGFVITPALMAWWIRDMRTASPGNE